MAGDPVAAVRLADAIIPALMVDSQFSRAEILGLVRALVDVDPASLQLATLPVVAASDGAGPGGTAGPTTTATSPAATTTNAAVPVC